MSVLSRRRAGRRHRARAPRSHWWSEAPWWAWVLMVLGAVALAVATTLAIQRDGAPGTVNASERGTATGPAEDTRIVVIGDGYTSGTARGGEDPTAWPALLEQRLEDVDVRVSAADGAGFLTANVFGRTIGNLAVAAPMADADLVVVFGGRTDGPDVAGELAPAASKVFQQARTAAPDAEILVIGPAWPGAQVPAEVLANRDSIAAAAAQARASFVDPLAAGWFGDQAGLIAPDGVHPTQQGQRYLADVIEPLVRDAIA